MSQATQISLSKTTHEAIQTIQTQKIHSSSITHMNTTKPYSWRLKPGL